MKETSYKDAWEDRVYLANLLLDRAEYLIAKLVADIGAGSGGKEGTGM